MDEFMKELRDAYPKELLTDDEFETAAGIADKKERREYVKRCLMGRNEYEGPKELAFYDDAWFEPADTGVFVEETQSTGGPCTYEEIVGHCEAGPLRMPVMFKRGETEKILEFYKSGKAEDVKSKIFDGAEFGDMYKTVDGLDAVYLSHGSLYHSLAVKLVDGSVILSQYGDDGVDFSNRDDLHDIDARAKESASCNKEDTRIVECPDCREVIEYSDKDIVDEVWVVCPDCKKRVCILE